MVTIQLDPIKNVFLNTANVVYVNSSPYIHTYMDVVEDNSIDKSAEFKTISLSQVDFVVNLSTTSNSATLDSTQSSQLVNLGIDQKSMLLNRLSASDEMEMVSSLNSKYLELGKEHFDDLFKLSGWKKFIYDLFSLKQVNFAKDDKSLISQLFEYAQLVHKKSRKGDQQFAIVSPQINSMLMDSSKYLVNIDNTNSSGVDMVYLAGSVGPLNIFVNRVAAPSSIILGTKTKPASVGVSIFENSRELQMVSAPNGNENIRILHRYAIEKVGGESAKRNYLALDFELKSKPWYRKWFNL